MRTQLVGLWERMRASYWFTPSVLFLLAVSLSFLMLYFDENEPPWTRHFAWLHLNEPEGARAILSTIATSMATIAGVTFSLTIVALSLASSQFGPRLLRNFMRDRGNQVALGTYVATFTYCLLILRSVRSENDVFVPHLSIAGALLLAILSLGVLIYFIHHVAESIQISTILARIGNSLELHINQTFPERMGEGREAEDARPQERLSGEAEPLLAATSGYIRTVDSDGLLRLAVAHDLVLELHCRPGDFVAPGVPLASVWSSQPLKGGLEERIHNEFVIGEHRNLDQDLAFGFDQLVEVASRALSPGVNDPFTAMMCIDRVAAGLRLMVSRKTPSPYRHDDEGKLRTIAFPLSFADAVGRTFGPIRSYGASSLAIILRLLEAIESVAACVTTDENRRILFQEALRVKRSGQRSLPEEDDREEVERAFSRAAAALGLAPAEAVAESRG